jgi:hypothetical protein
MELLPFQAECIVFRSTVRVVMGSLARLVLQEWVVQGVQPVLLVPPALMDQLERQELMARPVPLEQQDQEAQEEQEDLQDLMDQLDQLERQVPTE